jgi:adenosine deaminase
MILESAAGAVLQRAERQSRSTTSTVLDEFKTAEFVGFDLAGDEADYAPALFTEDFRRLSRLHVPMTVHAGENAPVRFIEQALLDLGAQRIGHGLSLPEDRHLMARVREHGVCVELCPVSNHQTCHFVTPGMPGRQYPLDEFRRRGVPFCLNTDNPLISCTNVTREYFWASSTVKGGLSLWDVLKIMKTGFKHAFALLPSRAAILATADQIVSDIFADADVVAMLEDLLRAPDMSA